MSLGIVLSFLFTPSSIVGLLTTPAEVIQREAGDCQGQAVTTASLLWALG